MRTKQRPRRLAEDRRGIATVEIAVWSPALLLLFLGFSDFVYLGRGQLRAQSAATQIGQIVSQCERVSTDDQTQIMNLAQSILGPFAGTGKEWAVVINVFGRDENNKAFSWPTPMQKKQGVVETTSTGSAVPTGLTLKASQVLFRTEVFVDVDTMLFSRMSPFLMSFLGNREQSSKATGTALHMTREANVSGLKAQTTGAVDCMTARSS